MTRTIFLLTIVSMLVLSAHTQTGSGFDLSHSVIASGGDRSNGTVSGITYSIEGTTGQGIAGTTSNSSSPQFSLRGGFWAFQDLAPTAAGVSVSGRVMTADGTPIGMVRVSLMAPDGTTLTAVSNAFGFYRIEHVEVGQVYFLNAMSKRFQFVPRAIAIHDELTDIDLIALP